MDVTDISGDALLEGATFSQYSDEAEQLLQLTVIYQVQLPPHVGVTIYYITPDGSEGILSAGKPGGVFNFVPMRGSDSNQTVYFRYINQDGKEVTASKQFTVAVAADLKPEIKLLVSDDGKKVWKWNYAGRSDGQVWGNLGDAGQGSGKDFAPCWCWKMVGALQAKKSSKASFSIQTMVSITETAVPMHGWNSMRTAQSPLMTAMAIRFVQAASL